MKDLNYAEKIKEVEDKFQDELNTDKAKYDRLMADKTDMEAAYDTRIGSFEARQASEVRAPCAYSRANAALLVLLPVVVVSVTPYDPSLCASWMNSKKRIVTRSPLKWTATTL